MTKKEAQEIIDTKFEKYYDELKLKIKRLYNENVIKAKIAAYIVEKMAFNEDDWERSENGRFSGYHVETSPSGKNTFKVQEFSSKQKLSNHWNEHKEEYKVDGITTKEQYLKRALNLVQSATNKNVLGHIDKDKNIIRYDIDKNDFVKGRPDKGIYTMLKPYEGKLYYDNQLKEDLKHGGKT